MLSEDLICPLRLKQVSGSPAFGGLSENDLFVFLADVTVALDFILHMSAWIYGNTLLIYLLNNKSVCL